MNKRSQETRWIHMVTVTMLVYTPLHPGYLAVLTDKPHIPQHHKISQAYESNTHLLLLSSVLRFLFTLFIVIRIICASLLWCVIIMFMICFIVLCVFLVFYVCVYWCVSFLYVLIAIIIIFLGCVIMLYDCLGFVLCLFCFFCVCCCFTVITTRSWEHLTTRAITKIQ